MPPRRRRRRWIVITLVAVLLLGAGAAVAGYLVLQRPGDVLNPEVSFGEAPPAEEKTRPADRFEWPIFGRTKDHRRFYDPPESFRGPWRAVWRHRAPALLEFPPVIFRGAIYQLADNGQLYSLRKRRGTVRWKRKLGFLAASSPAVNAKTVFVNLLERRKGSGQGRAVALRSKDGKIRWSRTLSSRSESSPLLHKGRLFFGTEDGTVLAVDARTGRTIWTYRASGAVKGSPTLSGGKLFFGDYGGRVHAVRASDGSRVWSVAPAQRLVRSGRFYATAAVAFGRVYIGSTDGREYSLSVRDGALAWARQTGGFVYSSAAVHNVPGLGPTVFVGSYDGNFYALNARSGTVRWKHDAGGRISGSPTIIGDTVFFADLGTRRTTGLKTRTGSVVFRRRPGAYDPIISDGKRLYLTGRSSLTALAPR